MLHLKKINFIKSILDEFNTVEDFKGSEYYKRLYDDAQISLIMMNLVEIEESSGNYFITIDNDKYKVNSRVLKFCSKKTNGNQKKNAESEKDSLINKVSEKEKKMRDEEMSFFDDVKIDTLINKSDNKDVEDQSKVEKKGQDVDGQSNVPEVAEEKSVNNIENSLLDKKEPYVFQGVIHKKAISIVNKSNPTDIRYCQLLIMPLAYKYQVTCVDIAAELEFDGKKFQFVSSHRIKSIAVEIGNMRLSIRGAWQEGNFVTSVTLTGANSKEYRLEINESNIAPDGFVYEMYEEQFVREIGDIKFYILPTAQHNAPNGLCNTVIVSETSENRQVFSSENNVVISHVQGVDYRLYGMWNADKEFVARIEPA